MSKSPILDPNTGISDLSDEELLERISQFDPDEYPLAAYARQALERRRQEDSL